MPKKVYFLSGFPRAGNTLLSTILNQNKKIAVSGHSLLPDCFFNLETLKNSPTFHNFNNEDSLENIKKNLVLNYYKHFKKPYVLDRGEWGTPFNYNLMEQYCPNEFKLIFLLRNPLDVIKSFLKLSIDYPDFYVNKQYNYIDKTTLYRPEEEEKIDLITQKNTFFDWSFYTYNNLKNKKNVLFIKYEELVKQPKTTIDSIYNFLKLPKFNHSFDIKNQFSVNSIAYDDSLMGAPMHKIHLGKVRNFNYSNIKLPKYVIEKYKGLIPGY